MFFPVVTNGCDSRTIKRAEHRRIDAFELWCWRRLLRVPWTPRSNQSILKEINTKYPLEGLMLKHLWPPDAKNWCIGKDPDAGKDWGQKEKAETENDMVRWLDRLSGHDSDQILVNSEGQRNLECSSPWGHKELDMTYQLSITTEWLRIYEDSPLSVTGCL